MVFVRKVTSKGNEYYVLIHSVRKGSRIIQKSKYLGKELPSKQKLEQIKKEFLLQLMKDKYKYITNETLTKVEKKKKDHKREQQRLTKSEREKNLNEFMIRFTYDSSKLAGVPITLRQTYLILQQGVIPKNLKSVKSIKELENHEKGFMMITKYRGVLNLHFIKKLHKTLMSGVDDAIAGKTRRELKRNVKIAGTIYLPPSWKELKKELDGFFKWYKSENRKIHAIELAALVHLRLISIQTFVDGNSRVARLLMNWILWKRNYPLIDIPIGDLETYYDTLDKYQIEKNEKPFVKYIIKRYLKEV